MLFIIFTFNILYLAKQSRLITWLARLMHILVKKQLRFIQKERFMKNVKLHIVAAIFAIGMFASASTALAIIVNPGQTVNLPGTTVASEPYLSGTILVDELIDFSFPATQQGTGLITGKVQQRVVRENITGTLDFYWRIYELTSGSLGYFRIGNFNSTIFDANYRIDGLGDVGPNSITRFMPGMGGATNNLAANFNFADYSVTGGNPDTLFAGSASLFMFLHTDATSYDKSAFFDVASTGTYTASQTFAAYSPTTPVPEPGTMMLLGIGMLGMAVYGKRRMNKEA